LKMSFREILEDTPIIAAVKNMEGLEKCLESDIRVIFTLFGDICTIGSIVDKIKDADKIAMIHLDLVSGLSGKEVALDFIKQNTRADGIITTKNTLIKYARQLGLYTVLRYFVVDSMALSNIEKQMGGIQPDVIEILPGIMPGIIKRVNKISKVPVIAGGLIADRGDVMTALNSGAIAISATSQEVWFL
jgi:glycerol uptake operon antiterminator